MTKLIFISSYIFLFIQINAQQSTTGKFRPENVSKGIIQNTSKTQIVIENVPTYIWHRGCGPTALGMLIGYYDMLGYTDLIQGDAYVQTADVNNAIANQQHYNDYSLPKDYYPDLFDDKSTTGGAHTSNCMADFMKTSWSSNNNRWGWSWSNHINDAFEEYINMQNDNYQTLSSYQFFSSSAWSIYKNEINNNRPVILLVDTDGDGQTDHFITGIGYDESTSKYAAYDTWDNDLHWFDWQGLANGNEWGIYGFNILNIITPVSIKILSNKSVSVFPVPAKDFLNIEIKNTNSSVEKISVSLYNYLGKEIKTLYFSERKFKINVSNLKKGIYFLEININKSEFLTKKVIVVK